MQLLASFVPSTSTTRNTTTAPQGNPSNIKRQLLQPQEGSSSDLRPPGASSPRTPRRQLRLRPQGAGAFASGLKRRLRLEHQGGSSNTKRIAFFTSSLKMVASPQTSRGTNPSNTRKVAPPASRGTFASNIKKAPSPQTSDLKGHLHLEHQKGSFSGLKRTAPPRISRR
ncbi:hypothetical protein FAUST_7924 [Fusarium austroamericanum]|uniref:Uncharacterized protein n=1 Tax=Fusarium austroamericanum TaxID=282268 RepID=A0AAN5Z7M8_FUSAU|nr:hypothetical protein FAUST_7924 [Fusarium austroamericanum]